MDGLLALEHRTIEHVKLSENARCCFDLSSEQATLLLISWAFGQTESSCYHPTTTNRRIALIKPVVDLGCVGYSTAL